MIDKLTKKQEELLDVYRDKWLRIGLSTERINREEGIRICNNIQTELLDRKATPVVFFDNPVEAWYAVCMFSYEQVERQVWGKVWDQVWGQIREQIGAQIRGEVGEQIREQVWVQVERQVWDQVERQVWDQVGGQIREQINGQIREQAGEQIRKQGWEQIWVQIRKQINDQIRGQVWEQIWVRVKNKAAVQIRGQVWGEVGRKVGEEIWRKVGEQIGEQTGGEVEEEIWEEISRKVGEPIGGEVEGEIRSEAEAQIRGQVWGEVDTNKFILPWLDGSFSANVFAYHDYMQNVLGVVSPLWDKFKLWAESSKLGLIYPLENICIVSEKPTKISMVNGVLHCDGGASIEYAGDFKVWSLNGIKVPQYLAETPSVELDINFWKKEKNADVRAEFVRKYGVERMLSECKLMDSWCNYKNEWWERSEYELYDAYSLYKDITKHDSCPHLKMKNQSTGIWHVEGVAPHCKTIEEALAWRENNKNNHETITIK